MVVSRIIVDSVVGSSKKIAKEERCYDRRNGRVIIITNLLMADGFQKGQKDRLDPLPFSREVILRTEKLMIHTVIIFTVCFSIHFIIPYNPNCVARMEHSTATESRKILSDEPKLSSAALCVTLQHLTKSFRPEFTHQCVEKETFRGHQPLQSALMEAQQQFPTDTEHCVLHQSHLHHDHASSELEVKVQLAPSCRTSQVLINSQPMKRKATNDPTPEDKSQSKKQKLNESGEAPTTISSQNQIAPTVTPNVSLFASTEVAPLSKLEIQESITKALPEIGDAECDKDYLKAPIGTALKEYSVQEKQFVCCLADGTEKKVSEYHQQVQKLALWFIENADDVDVADDQSGSWKVLYLFQKLPEGYALVGYITLFHFSSPFHKPEPGIIVRICQALVLPPFQGQGHGQRMMQCVYDVVHEKYTGAYDSDQNIVRVNVEDPAPGFVAMRNKADMKLLADHPEWWPSSRTNLDIVDEAFFSSIPEAEAVQLSARAKITPHQIHIVNELLKLQALQSFDSSKEREELERRYRLLVKRRLNKDYGEEMGAYSTKDQKKEFLAKLFDEQFAHYETLLGRSKK
jgi:histone acetyltransferase 1